MRVAQFRMNVGSRFNVHCARADHKGIGHSMADESNETGLANLRPDEGPQRGAATATVERGEGQSRLRIEVSVVAQTPPVPDQPHVRLKNIDATDACLSGAVAGVGYATSRLIGLNVSVEIERVDGDLENAESRLGVFVASMYATWLACSHSWGNEAVSDATGWRLVKENH
jgi:hypothetical protein